MRVRVPSPFCMKIDLDKYAPFASPFSEGEYNFTAYIHRGVPAHFLVVVTKNGEDYDQYEVDLFFKPTSGVDIADIQHLEDYTATYIEGGFKKP